MIRQIAILSVIVGTIDDGRVNRMNHTPISADQFIRIVKDQQRIFKDISFVFEGAKQFIGSKVGLEVDPSLFDSTFQGNFQFRSDGAKRLETYAKSVDRRNKDSHQIVALFGRQFEMGIPSTRKGESASVIKVPGGLESFFDYHSPMNYMYVPVFGEIKDGAPFGYRFIGWEEYNGNTCACVEINWGNGGPIFVRAWVDLARGAHPLKIQVFNDDKLVSSADNITLKRVGVEGGGTVWFPVEAELHEYTWNHVFYKEPVFRETSHVVRGSLRINQQLHDSTFNLLARLTKDAANPAKTARAAAFSGRDASPRSDPARVKRVLDEQLHEAERQARLLDASASAQWEQSRDDLLPIVCFAIGTCALCVVVIKKVNAQ